MGEYCLSVVSRAFWDCINSLGINAWGMTYAALATAIGAYLMFKLRRQEFPAHLRDILIGGISAAVIAGFLIFLVHLVRAPYLIQRETQTELDELKEKYEPALPTITNFQEWAKEFAVASRGRKPAISREREAIFEAPNNVSYGVYREIIDSSRSILVAYRTAIAPNLRIELPSVPLSVFGDEAALYRGNVTFSRDCSLSVRMLAPSGGSRSGPVLSIELMDGDGQIQSGSGVGNLSIWYDFEGNSVEIRLTGKALGILSSIPRSIPRQQVSARIPEMLKLLVENQLETCDITEAGIPK